MLMSITRSILRATDGTLRTDNWQYILDVCDRVREDPEDGGEEAMQVIEERLEQKDANVILRTLSLIVSLAENCGSRLKQLISSKHFTRELYALIESKSVHTTVKRETAKMVKQLASSFKDDPSLRYMGDLLSRIRSSAPHLLESDQPNVPSKKEMSTESKVKEDQDFEEALKLSLAEYEQQQQRHEQPPANVSTHSGREAEAAPRQQDVESSAPAVIKKVRAMYDLSSTEADELSFRKGDVIVVLEQVYRDWWRGTLCGKVGIFPLNYVTPIEEPSSQELEAERRKEDALFSQKAHVDQLYYTLERSKTSGNDDLTQNPAINDLYGSVTPLRPQVAKTIGKYARKREDLASLRQVLATAEATYNQLLDRATNAYTSPVPQQYAASSGHGPTNGTYGREAPQPPYYSRIPNQPAARSEFAQPNYNRSQQPSFDPREPFQGRYMQATESQYINESQFDNQKG